VKPEMDFGDSGNRLKARKSMDKLREFMAP
jgi:hypothetical protein